MGKSNLETDPLDLELELELDFDIDIPSLTLGN